MSNLTQQALRSPLAASRLDDWLDDVNTLRPVEICHRTVAAAVAAAKQELEGHG